MVQVLINLALNARDAMLRDRELALRTENVTLAVERCAAVLISHFLT